METARQSRHPHHLILETASPSPPFNYIGDRETVSPSPYYLIWETTRQRDAISTVQLLFIILETASQSRHLHPSFNLGDDETVSPSPILLCLETTRWSRQLHIGDDETVSPSPYIYWRHDVINGNLVSRWANRRHFASGHFS